MALQKGTILPQDPAQAEQKFKEEVAKRQLVLMVVLGTSPDAEKLAKLADGLAGVTRWVILAEHPEAIQAAVAALDLKAGVQAPNLSEPDHDHGFAISFDKEITFVIRSEDSVNSVRVLRAYNSGI